MSRHRRNHSGGHDRWLISYADFITLLFAFFVVLFASSHADRSKAKRVSDAVKKAFNGQVLEPVHSTTASPGTPPAPPSLDPVFEGLSKELQPEIRSGKMRVRMEQRGIIVSLSQASFFPSGEDSVDLAMSGSLGKVADVVAGLPNLIRLEGHTDSLPIHTPRFRDNWDLSSARAIAMLQLLRDHWHILPGRLAVTGYAETIPVESNNTETGRAHNRRVDIVILNGQGANFEPKAKL